MINLTSPANQRTVRYRSACPSFAFETRDAKRILAIEIAGLGDLVHSLPALFAVRQAYPGAELNCLTRPGNASLLKLVPWIDRVLPYRRGWDGTLSHHVERAWSLRRERYDVAIDLIGADYSGIVAAVSGAPRRLIRRPGVARPRWAWRHFGTDIIESTFGVSPMYRQRLDCLHQAGIVAPHTAFQLADLCKVVGHRPLVVSEQRGGYIHVSPFTKLQSKELSLDQMATLLGRVNRDFPDHPQVLTCSGTPRERAAMKQLLRQLPFAPWKVFEGTLDIPELLSIIRNAAIHVGGNTGTIHLAWLAGTPSVSWFRLNAGISQWTPSGRQHLVVTTKSTNETCLQGIDSDQLLFSMKALIGTMEPIRAI